MLLKSRGGGEQSAKNLRETEEKCQRKRKRKIKQRKKGSRSDQVEAKVNKRK